MVFAYINARKADTPVRRACDLLGVSESGFYAWRSRPASRRQQDDMILLAHIRVAFTGSNETYGSPRMLHEMHDLGFSIGRRRVALSCCKMACAPRSNAASSVQQTAIMIILLPLISCAQ